MQYVKRWAVATIAAFAVIGGVELLVSWLMSDPTIGSKPFDPSPREIRMQLVWTLVGELLLAAVLTLVYPWVRKPDRRGISQGVRFGFLSWLAMAPFAGFGFCLFTGLSGRAIWPVVLIELAIWLVILVLAGTTIGTVYHFYQK